MSVADPEICVRGSDDSRNLLRVMAAILLTSFNRGSPRTPVSGTVYVVYLLGIYKKKKTSKYSKVNKDPEIRIFVQALIFTNSSGKKYLFVSMFAPH